MKTTRRLSLRTTVLAAMLIPSALIRAQIAPPQPASAEPKAQTPAAAVRTVPAPAREDDVVMLSPFEVEATGDSDSYTASSTLAGNRLNTQLRDIGSSVTVVTSQFLKDTGATDNTSLLLRIGGTEVGGVYGNYASPGSDTTSSLLTEDTIKPSEDTRIRGLAAADNTHDFFASDIPWDAYNTDSIDIQRGPNSILFGQGSPAGIINASSKEASFRNSGEIEARYGSYGSTRATLDINRVLVADQVAMRLEALNDHELYEQKPAYNKDQRISGAIRIDPAALRKNGNHTIFKANFESGQINSNNPRALPPTDHITPWFTPGDTGAYQAGLNGLEAWQTSPGPSGVSSAANGYAAAGRAVGAQNPDPWFTNGQLGNSSFPLAAFQNGSTVGPAGTYAFTSLPQPGTASNTGLAWPYGAFPGAWLTVNGLSKEAVFGGLPYANGGLFTDTSLTNPSVFNFYKNLIDGNLKSEWQRFWSGTADVTQTFLDEQVGFSLDYNKQHYEDGAIDPFGGAVPLYVDVMSTLNQGPGGTTVTGPQFGPPTNAAANPNYGRPFVINNDNATNFTHTSDRQDSRATAFVTHDFKKGGDGWWQSLLGVETLTGLADSAKLTTDTRNWQQYGYLGANTLLAAQMDGLSNANFQNVAPQQVIYLGPSLYGKSLAGANISRITGNPTIGSEPVNFFDFTPNPANSALSPTDPNFYNGWTGGQTLQVTNSESNPLNRQLLATSDAITRSVTTSQALVYEGKWLDDALVGIYGWRRDINKSWADTASLGDANDPQNINFNNIGFSSSPQGRVEVQSRSYSIVAHLGEFPGLKEFANRLPVDISLSYGTSTNFEPDASRVDINGDPIAPPAGTPIDRGILIETRDGRYSLKVDRYVTSITNGSNPNGNTFGQELANFVGFSAYYGNVFYYHTDQSTPVQAGPGSVAAANPGIGPDGGPAGAGLAVGGEGSGWYFDANNYHTQAMENLQNASTAATRAWETQLNTDFPNFYKNWGMGSLAQVQAGTDTRNQLQNLPGETNFAIGENSQSAGWEIELDANPIPNWRISVNATKTDAVITEVGDPALAKFMADTAAYVAGHGGQQQWFWGQDVAPSVPDVGLAYYNQYNGSLPALGTYYAELLQQQNVAVKQLAKWRFNLTTNYDFTHSFLKGFNVGGGVRYTSAEIIGYPPTGDPANPPPYLPDLSKPEMSPSETYFDLWVGYHFELTRKIDYKVQLNVANVGKGNYLIPVSYQAPINGLVQPAFYRIGPSQQFTLTNTFSF